MKQYHGVLILALMEQLIKGEWMGSLFEEECGRKEADP